MDFSFPFADHPTASWAAVTGLLSVIGAFLVRYRKIIASIERARIMTAAETTAAEVAERAAFRTSLMAEMAVVRTLIKECEADKDLLRQRLNAAEGQILILKASNEIMEKWVAFFRDGVSPQATALSEAGNLSDSQKHD